MDDKKAPDNLRSSHTPEAIRRRLREGSRHSYLRDFIYGAVDGAVTTFAVVSGVAGADLSSGIVLILGAANLAGDGFSMAVSNFLGTRADLGLRALARRMEERHIEQVPEGEREEVRQIFAAKGFRGRELENAVRIITSDREQWINTMLREELGLEAARVSPLRAAGCTFLAFILAGSLPLAPFVVRLLFPSVPVSPFPASLLMTGAAFFTIGAFKGRFVEERWYRSGLETLAVGGAAALLAFAAGWLLRRAVPL